MKKALLISTVIIFLFLINALPQEAKIESLRKNQIGFQLNPYINDQFFDFRYMNAISALRYGYRLTENISAGLEFACSFPVNLASDKNFQYFNYFSYKIGLITRYSILPDKRIQIFAEGSPFFSHYCREQTSSTDPDPYTNNLFGYYFAPGVTLYSKSKRISFDLYSKFSNHTFINGNKYVISYKVNFNF